jgi:hypothetical protein
MKKIILFIMIFNFSFGWESYKITTPIHQFDKKSKYDLTKPNKWIDYSIDIDEKMDEEIDPFLQIQK